MSALSPLLKRSRAGPVASQMVNRRFFEAPIRRPMERDGSSQVCSLPTWEPRRKENSEELIAFFDWDLVR